MSYTFKVGDKGKTRGGEDYEVICVEPRVTEGEKMVSLVSGSLRFYEGDGSYWCDGSESKYDLIPPSRKVKVRFVDFGHGIVAMSENNVHFNSSLAGASYNRTIEVELPE